MSELVFKGNNNQALTTSLLVAEKFGKRHDNVLRDIEGLSCSSSFRSLNFEETPYVNPQNGQTYRMYAMTKDGFTFLVMGYTGETAGRFKEDYINAFNNMEEIIRINIPQETPQELMARALIMAQKTLDGKSKQLEVASLKIKEDAPKVDFFETVTNSKNTVDMGTVAKVLNMGIGRNNLFEFLRENKILMGNNIPFQKYIDSGWFRIIEVKFVKPNGDVCINMKTIVYQKGVEAIRRLITSKKT